MSLNVGFVGSCNTDSVVKMSVWRADATSRRRFFAAGAAAIRDGVQGECGGTHESDWAARSGRRRHATQTLCRFAQSVLIGDDQPAEDVQVAAQDAQGGIPFEAEFTLVTASFESVA